jgi:peroxiredoxin
MSVRAVLIIAFLAVASFGAGYAVRLLQAPGPMQTSRPAFVLPDLQGKSRSVDEWDGKVLVVNFWATWCAPCRREIPMFVEMQQQYGDRGLQFLGVAVDNVADVSQFATEMGINYPLLVSEQEAIALAEQMGNRMGVLPFTAIIDRQGKVVFTKAGELSRKQADRLLLPLL